MKQMLKKTPLTAGMLVVLAVVLYACGGGGSYGGGGGGGGSYGGSTMAPPPATSTVQVVPCSSVTPSVTVSITEYMFTGSAVHAPIGGVVMWTNNGTMEHSVTSGAPAGTPNGLFDQTLTPGQSVCFKFTTGGTFNYYCKFHFTLGMIGSVTVP